MNILKNAFKIVKKDLKGPYVHNYLNWTSLRTLTTEKPLPLNYFNENEVTMRDSVARLAKDKILPIVRKMEKEERFDKDLLKSLFENGIMSIEIPLEYGGAGCSLMTTVLTVEEIAKIDTTLSGTVAIQNGLICKFIFKLGTKEQKDKYLPQLTQNMLGSFCLSEASSGSDAFSMKTTATKDGDFYIINGSKMWISNADIADIFIVFVNADPSKGYRGITAFLIDRNTPGLEVGPNEDKIGLKASGTCPVHFDNVKVPSSAVLGVPFEGYKYAAGLLNESRIGIAAQMLGSMQGTLDQTIPYTLQRKQFGQSIYDFQSVQNQIADLVARVELVRTYIYNTARLVETGQPFAKEAAIAKYTSSELAQEVTRKCIDFMGGVGYTTAFLQEKFYRDCKIGTIYEGTSNMQLSVIAKHLKKEYS